jgi:hypothetical protein
MITGKEVFGGIVTGLMFMGGIYIGSNYLPTLPAIPAAPQPPVCIDDALKVMARLRPLTAQGFLSQTKAYLYIWAGGSIDITVETLTGSKLVGKGNTLAEAVSDLSRSGDGAKAALAGWKAEDAK